MHLVELGMRLVWLGVGWGAVALAFTGVWLPLLPTVPFLLVAAWAFARGSPAARRWLFDHPRFGAMLRDWHHHGRVPARGKVLSVAGMSASYALLVTTTSLPAWVFALIGLMFLTIAGYVLSRPTAPRD